MYELAVSKGIKTYAVTLPELEMERNFARLSDVRLELNGLIKEYCSATNITVIDLAKELPRLTLTKEQEKELWGDGLHLTAKGYDRFGEIVFAAIKQDL